MTNAKKSSKGRATQPLDVAYQNLCQTIVDFFRENEGLQPYADDGIDVAIPVAMTDVVFDIALKNADGTRLVVAECRRIARKEKQEALFALSGKVEALRKATGLIVDGIFFAKSGFQIGVAKAARGLGLRLMEVREGQHPNALTFAELIYEPQARRVRRAWGVRSSEVFYVSDTVVEVARVVTPDATDASHSQSNPEIL